nr:RelA/SpoT domain-containing protein [Labrys sp. LIt4]
MQAIRGKLQRSPVKLHQFQDIGGCRVIVNTMQDIDVIVNKLKAHSRHQYRKDSNYIGSPKADGYRCHHLMFNFVGRGDADIFTGRRIEIQVRTRLQHAWATAVEGVGMFRGEYLKGSVGHDGWLELFRLASEEFATIEGAPYQNSGLSTLQRRKRLRELDSELQALNTLNNIRSAVEWTSVAIKAGDRPDYYLITFDNLDKTVSVSPYFGPKEALKSYGEAEANDNAAGSELNNVVLVQADKIEYLQEAYPNYFGDTKLFRNVLAKSIYGFNEDEFTLKMQPLAPARPRENPDMSWFRKWKRLS